MKKSPKHSEIILKMLKKQGTVTIADAMTALSVSESTARRVFTRLEEGGYALRYHGGIRAVKDGIFDYSYDDMKTKYIPEKKLLAKYAASLVEKGDTVYLDAGTTIKYLTFALAARCEKGELSGVRFFTNSLTDFGILRDRADINLIGGKYRSERKDFAGKMAEEMLEGLHFSKSFIGADGCTAAARFTTTDFETAALCNTAMSNSDSSFILMNWEKFGKTSLVSFGKEAKKLTLITDRLPNEEIKRSLEAGGISVISVK